MHATFMHRELAAALGPKLEDFLGCGNCGIEEASAEIEGSICDSELKAVAAGFLESAVAVQTEQLTSASDGRKAVDTFGQRTSIYRGVTRRATSVGHRWTGRYEAHLWDNSCRREGQSRKGRQVYLGGYDKEEKAAKAYDLAAIKYWGPTTTTNFPVSDYEKEMEEMKNMTRQGFVASLRRKSSGFSRGASIYRGVTRHHQHGRWQARIGRVAGNKDLYLGTFSTQEEAAEAYDIAAIKFRGINAVTNFDMSRYDVKSIANSELPIGCLSGRATKASDVPSSTSSEAIMAIESRCSTVDGRDASSSSISAYSHSPIKQEQDYWSLLAFQQQQQHLQNNVVYASGVNMDFSSAGNLVWGNGVLQFAKEDNCNSYISNSPILYATPVGFGGRFEGSTTLVGNWVSPTPPPPPLSPAVAAAAAPPPPPSFYHQTAKPNVAVFQTPIFGME
ncbi:hypothetical protein HPP92_010510 [Vanilla planifolia]|uniref:AP2/ERF domain-containing protein n=1 Tax=Vanilla planifolia TaxID=51239 RepID=A0A835V454_VANPL|nr:hypothetical protein HPP92_010510 [Vanilla planifolia]